MMIGLVRGVCWAWLAVLSHGLYEDQIGLNDWYLQHVGQVSHVEFHGQIGLFASDEGVVAGIQSTDGKLLFRDVIPETSGTEVSSGGFSSMSVNKKKLFTLSKDGCTGRLWVTSNGGGLVWEAHLCASTTSSTSSPKSGATFIVGDDASADTIMTFSSVSNQVSLLSTSSGQVTWTWKPESFKIIGVTEAGFVYGESNGELHIAKLDPAKGALADSWTVEGKGVGVTSLYGINKVFFADAQTKKIMIYDLNTKKAQASSVETSSSSLQPVGKTPFLQAGENVVYHFNGKDLVQEKDKYAAVGGGLVAKSNNEGAILGIVQDVSAANCGPISKMVWKTFPDGKTMELDFPEPIGQSGARGPATKVFVQPATTEGGGASLRVVVKFADDSIVAVQHRRNGGDGKKTSEVLYIREEALANIVQTSSVELPASIGAMDYDPVIADETSHIFTHGNALNIYVYRLRDQVRTLKNLLQGMVNNVLSLFTTLIDSKGMVLVKLYKGELGAQGQYSNSEMSNFGFSRGLVLLTKVGKLFLLDSMTGTIKYGTFDSTLASTQEATKMFVTRAREAGASHPAEVLFVSKASGVVQFRNALTGAVLRTESRKTSIREIVFLSGDVLHHHGFVEQEEEDVSPAGCAVIIDDNMKASIVPSKKQERIFSNQRLMNAVHFLEYDVSTSTVNGYGVDEDTKAAVQVFSYVIPKDHKILTLQGHVGGKVDNPGIKLGDGSVLVKYINPNLILVVTQTPQNDLIATVLDGISGRVIKRLSHKQSTGPVKALLFDNMVVYTYFNINAKRSEVSVAGFFDGAIDKRGLNIWTSRDEDALGAGGSFSSFDSINIPSVLQRSFFVEKVVRTLGVTNTLHGIADRRVLIGFESGGINMEPRQFLDPRRPSTKLTDAEKEEGLVQYFPQLPIVPTFTITYNLTLSRINAIHTMPTKLESTSLVFATGLDLFFTRVVPSKGFDLLDEDFNFALLVLLTTGLFIATVVLSQLVEKKKLDSAWK